MNKKLTIKNAVVLFLISTIFTISCAMVWYKLNIPRYIAIPLCIIGLIGMYSSLIYLTIDTYKLFKDK